jgi:hypothetical protein
MTLFKLGKLSILGYFFQLNATTLVYVLYLLFLLFSSCLDLPVCLLESSFLLESEFRENKLFSNV